MTGKIVAEGKVGSIEFQWTRSDRQPAIVVTQPDPDWGDKKSWESAVKQEMADSGLPRKVVGKALKEMYLSGWQD